MKSFTAAAVLAALGASAWADEIQLRDGRKLVNCIAVEKNGRVEVDLGTGHIDFDKKDVMSIKAGPCALKQYPQLLDEARKAGKAGGLLELAQWCRKEGLSRYVRPLFEEILKLEPDHAVARKELGFQKVEGKWLSGDALKKAQGYVRVDGVWMTPIDAELQKGKTLVAKARALDAAEEKERQRLEAESARLLNATVDAERAAEQRRLAEQQRELRMRRYYYGNRWYQPWGGYSVLGSFGIPYGGWIVPTNPYGGWPIWPLPPKPTTPAPQAPVKFEMPKTGPVQTP